MLVNLLLLFRPLRWLEGLGDELGAVVHVRREVVEVLALLWGCFGVLGLRVDLCSVRAGVVLAGVNHHGLT